MTWRGIEISREVGFTHFVPPSLSAAHHRQIVLCIPSWPWLRVRVPNSSQLNIQSVKVAMLVETNE